ncbi:flagellar protein FlbD [Desulfitispora alkaliphila]|uniref:flagellar FlbD family protein n=1 Tax=Desulfitispora alkaliphila TaxID=622674 RepID=UPI003D235A8E
MIKVSRINGKELVVNSDLIEFVEATPDTVISLSTGRKIVVADSVDEVIDKVIEFRRATCQSINVKVRDERSEVQ